MKLAELYEILIRQRTLYGRELDVAVQVNEDEVYLVRQCKMVFRTENGKKFPHCMILEPELFREPTGLPPCAHLNPVIPAKFDAISEKYSSTFCPDCGEKLKHPERIRTDVVQ